ncbi:MAG: hypothetical protein ACKOCZ_01840 [Betaproteobacteria bacterium]
MQQKKFEAPAQTSPTRPMTGAKTQHLQKICLWIADHCHENITWDDLGRVSGMSHQQLVLLFRVHKKTTPMAFVRQCQRLSKK